MKIIHYQNINPIISYFTAWVLALIFMMSFGSASFYHAFATIVAAQFIIWANDILKGV
jgi:hypothetical protein